MELVEAAKRVLENFDALRKLLASRADCLEDVIEICEDPLRVVIKRDRIEFYIDDDLHGFVSASTCQLSDTVADEARMWLEALSMLKFKRYSVRR